MSRDFQRLRRNFIIPLLVVLLTLILSTFIILTYLGNENINNITSRNIKNAKLQFYHYFEFEGEILDSLLNEIKKTSDLQKGWKSGDLHSILQYSRPIYNSMKIDHGITHFYFYDTEMMCKLAVHTSQINPDGYFNNVTLKNSWISGLASSGLSLNENGILLINSIHPWGIDGKLSGYIEIGMDIEHVSIKLKKVLDIEMFVSLYKQQLKKENWEYGLHKLGRSADWNQFDDFVLIDSTLQSIPTILEGVSFEKLQQKTNKNIRLSKKNRLYRMGIIPLYNIEQSHIGNIVIFYDITSTMKTRNRSFFVLFVIYLFIGGALFTFVYIFSGRIEKGLKRTYNSLKIEIENRLALEKALYKAKERAESANRAKSLFLANMSHEIRTPMNAILGYAKIIINKFHNKDVRYYANIITESGKTLLAIINDILDLSKIEAGKIDLHFENVELMSLVREIDNIFRMNAEEKGIEFQITVKPEIPYSIYFDNLRLKQILVNLISNAIKFTDSGFVRVTLSLSKFSSVNDNTSILTIDVQDSGIGIEPDQISLIFEPFVQSKDQSIKYGGTGLGLTITSHLVKILGGIQSVTSTPDQGTHIFIQFNNLKISLTEQQSDQHDIQLYEYNFFGAHILLVDDNPNDIQLINTYLTTWNIIISEVYDGEQALLFLEKNTIDMIIMDLVMPELDGFQTARIIKNQSGFKSIPLVAQSARVMQDDKNEALKAGFDSFLEKPVDPEILIKILQSYLRYEKNDTATSPQDKLETTIDLSHLDSNEQQTVHDLITDTMYTRWQEISESMVLDEWTGFSNWLTEVGERYGIEVLCKTGLQISDNISTLNIKKLRKAILLFPKLVYNITMKDRSIE